MTAQQAAGGTHTVWDCYRQVIPGWEMPEHRVPAGRHRAIRHPVRALAAAAVLVPLLLATLAVLAACTPEDWPVTDGPATTVPVPTQGGGR